MIVIPDFGLIISIVDGLKTTHRFPAGVARDGHLADSKIAPKTEHKVYEKAPHGSHGNPAEPYYVLVEVIDVFPSQPFAWTDEDMRYEGFASVDQYGEWWDYWRAGRSKLAKPWIEMQDAWFWCVVFKPTQKSLYYDRRKETYRPFDRASY